MKYCLEKFITNCDKGLLQIATGTLLQIATNFITNCDNRYYKLRQVLEIATLLQIATVHSPRPTIPPPWNKSISVASLRPCKGTNVESRKLL